MIRTPYATTYQPPQLHEILPAWDEGKTSLAYKMLKARVYVGPLGIRHIISIKGTLCVVIQ
ncbi:hypothetical protein ACFL2W_00265, partial [Candidatus Omnitrophota bacterium]